MSDKLETWAVVEVFGHDRIAGFLTEQEWAGVAFFRVDVPEVDGEPGYSKFFNPSSVYSWVPVTEEVARAAVISFAVRPLGTWTPSVLRALPAPTIDQPVLADGPGEVGAEDEIQWVGCNECDEQWPYRGSYVCPACGSDDTEPLD
jgi:hypothetical protein